MGKKQVAVSLRKPPPPADFDRFVAGGEPARPAQTEAEAPAPRTAEGPVVATRTGERREVTIYLPQDLARKLSVRCVEMDRDVSNVIAEALSKSLDGEQEAPVVPVTVPADRWERAKAILSELRGRFAPRLRFGIL
jgi:hypothetical protein